jgi:hypothetical protein
MLDQLVTMQRWIYAGLSADLTAFAATRDWTALAALLPTGVLFGAVHADSWRPAASAGVTSLCTPICEYKA